MLFITMCEIAAFLAGGYLPQISSYTDRLSVCTA